MIDNLKINGILIPDDGCSDDRNSGSAIRCINIGEQGFKFRRMNLHYNGEEFFMTKEALKNSKWKMLPENVQIRFY